MIVDASVVIDAVADPGPRGAAARDALARQPAAEQMSSPGHLAFEVLSGLRAAANRPTHPLQPNDVEQPLHDAERLETTLVTAGTRLERTGAHITCSVLTVTPQAGPS